MTAEQLLPGEEQFSLEDVARALLQQRGIDKGIWRLSMRLRFAAATTDFRDPMKPDESSTLPSGLVGVQSVSLVANAKLGEPLAFDAAALAAPMKQRGRRIGAKKAAAKP